MTASASALTLPVPKTFQDVRKAAAFPSGQIYAELAKAQCGGWDLNQSVSAKQLIATVTGAPGRGGDPLGNPDSGMAKRNDAFSFPTKTGDVTGFTTACAAKHAKFVEKNTSTGKRYVRYPYFEDPPCLWRPRQTGSNDYVQIPGPLSEDVCKKFYEYLNGTQWQYKNAKGVDTWVCTDEEVGKGKPNASECKGSACRTTDSFYRKYPNIQTTRGNLGYTSMGIPNSKPSDILDRIGFGDGTLKQPIRAACYGFYREYDPKTTKTTMSDQRCVIALPMPSAATSVIGTLRQTQRAMGQFWNSTFDATKPDPLPPARSPLWNAAQNLWYPNLGGGMSFLSYPVFDGNVTRAVREIDDASMSGGYQNTPAQPWAVRSTLRAVDDTAGNDTLGYRPFTTWWQRLETDAHRLLTPPVVHLRVPLRWIAWLDTLSAQRVTVVQTGPVNRLTQTVDAQIDAGEDLMGVIAGFLRHAILPIREEQIPVVVPLGSPVEFRDYAKQWEQWAVKRGRARLPVPAQVTDLVRRLNEYAAQIERTRALRGEMGRYLTVAMKRQQNVLAAIERTLRTSGKIYDDHLKDTRARLDLQSEWIALQKEYASFAEQANTPWCRNDRFTTPIYSLLDPWYPGRPSLAGGIPACGTSAPGWSGKASLPMLCISSAERDVLIDLSMLNAGTGALLLPVLKPIQVRVAVPLPGDWRDGVTDASSLVLPQLPPVPIVSANALDSLLPDVVAVTNASFIQAPSPLDVAAAKRAIEQARAVIGGMKTSYANFWSSLDLNPPAPKQKPTCVAGGRRVALQPLECCAWGESTCVHVEMDLMERVQRIVARPAVLAREDLDTLGVSRVPTPDPRSVFVGSYRRIPKKNATCWPEDHACAAPLPEKIEQSAGFKAIPPTEIRSPKISIDGLREYFRNAAILPDGTVSPQPATGGAKPVPYVVPAPRLYPAFGVPDPTRITP